VEVAVKERGTEEEKEIGSGDKKRTKK